MDWKITDTVIFPVWNPKCFPVYCPDDVFGSRAAFSDGMCSFPHKIREKDFLFNIIGKEIKWIFFL